MPLLFFFAINVKALIFHKAKVRTFSYITCEGISSFEVSTGYLSYCGLLIMLNELSQQGLQYDHFTVFICLLRLRFPRFKYDKTMCVTSMQKYSKLHEIP